MIGDGSTGARGGGAGLAPLIDPNTTALYAMLGFLLIAGAVIFWREQTVA